MGGRRARLACSSFKTFVTGELFSAIKDHTIAGAFARAAPPEAPGKAFANGVSRGAAASRGEANGGLLGALFGVRSLPLMGKLAEDEAGDYLSGLLIGAEIAEGRRLFPDEARAGRRRAAGRALSCGVRGARPRRPPCPATRRGARAPCGGAPGGARLMLFLAPIPLVAILRGVKPEEAEAIASVLVEAGFGAVEVPLNSPNPLTSIETIARKWGDRILVGAGTVLAPEAVDRTSGAGARLIVAPNASDYVIERAVKLGLTVLPGVATPTEAFRALELGASGLKLFPAEAMPPEIVKAWRSVLPKDTQLFPVGGITAERIAPYRKAGADGFGVGGALYKPGASAAEVARAATAFVAAWRAAGEAAPGSGRARVPSSP